MRYYSITLTDPRTGQVLVPSSPPNSAAFTLSGDPTQSTWTSLNAGANVNVVGGTNPAAQRIELDITASPLHTADGNAKPFIRVWGVPLAQVAQAADLNGMFFSISGGMSKGLPLSDPSQIGVLATGQVLQCTGEWFNTDQNLTLYLAPGGSSATYSSVSGAASAMQPVTATSPVNLVFQWVKGQQMSDAIAQALGTAFPSIKVQMSISASLVWGSDVPKTGYFQTLQQFAVFVNEASRSVLAGPNPSNTIYAPSTNPAYLGVQIVLSGGVLLVLDHSTETQPKQIKFQDLRGQPNWSAPGQVQLVTTLRGDISVGDYVQFPPVIGTTGSFGSPNGGVSPLIIGNSTTSTSLYPGQGNSGFQGTALVQKVRHLGDSRSPNGLAWITAMNCAFSQPTAGPATNPGGSAS